MTEQEQLIDALKAVERYLRNQELSEIGIQVKGKVLEALNRVDKDFILYGIVSELPLSKNCEYFNSDECDCMDGFCHYGEKR